MIHVANLQLRPHSSLEEPWRFESLSEAMEFCRVIRRPFYAAVVGDTSRYQMWPGGRVHEYRESVWNGVIERNKRARAARKNALRARPETLKNPGTGSGTQSER